MIMKSYEQFLQTNNYWYPKLPLNWKVCKVKYIADTISGGTPSTQISEYWENGDIPWLPSGKLQNCEITTAEKFISEVGFNNSSTKWIKPNTVLVALTGATCANIGYLTFKACANQSVIAINENKNIANSRFLFYMFLEMRSQILTHQTGGAQAGINDSNVKNLFLMLPPIQEQSQIAHYLDHQTSLIDEIISRKEKQIELLKEKRHAIISETVTKGLILDAKTKDSGIEWLGEIPDGWKISYLKRFCSKITDGAHFSPKTELEGRNYISVKDVDEYGKIDLENCKKISQTDFDDLVKNGCQPQVNDVLLTKDGTIGRAAVVGISNDFVALSSLGIITPFPEILDSYYLRYFLISGINVSQMYSLIAGAALTRLTIEKIKHLIITIPPIDEQKVIVLTLNSKVKNFNELINIISVQIEKLKEYRQSIISEAVTGKIDVRDWQPNNA